MQSAPPSLSNDSTPADRLRSLSLADEYRTGSSEPISDFYAPCLSVSRRYCRAVGYFRSSIYQIVGPAIVDFARKKGMISLVCSPELTEDDQNAIESGYKNREGVASERIEEEIDRLLADPELQLRVRILATLIATGAMEVRIAIRPPSHGLYHEKIGIFSDAHEEHVSFIGSANESWSGWHEKGNFESVEVFRSWRDQSERDRAERHLSNFKMLWDGTTKDVMTVPFPEAARRKLCMNAATSIDDAEREAAAHWDVAPKPLEQKKRTLMPHQQNAIDAWIAQGVDLLAELTLSN